MVQVSDRGLSDLRWLIKRFKGLEATVDSLETVKSLDNVINERQSTLASLDNDISNRKEQVSRLEDQAADTHSQIKAMVAKAEKDIQAMRDGARDAANDCLAEAQSKAFQVKEEASLALRELQSKADTLKKTIKEETKALENVKAQKTSIQHQINQIKEKL